MITATQDHFFDPGDVESLGDEYESSALSPRELQAFGRVTGHRYEEFVTTLVNTDREYLPLFHGKRGGRPFTTFTMSRGEYWAAYMLWALREASRDEVVLIDEPETFLAGPAHAPLVDEIARISSSNGCQVILATHSTPIIEHVPATALRLVHGAPGGSVVFDDVDAETVLRTLARPATGVSSIVFVEDELASRIVRSILDRRVPHLSTTVEVIPSGGEAEARAAARVVSRASRLRIAVVLDGDLRDKADPRGVSFLPGRSAPEVELLEALRSRTDEVAAALGVEQSSLAMALAGASVGDHHRAFSRIGGAIGREEGRVLEAVISVWMAGMQDDVEMNELVEMLGSFPTRDRPAPTW
ncbi:AAA family ATPase [Curtobacterium flaccumfaciens]|nr:AAA family ATPase [Curtobacterium flaccumfaciens]